MGSKSSKESTRASTSSKGESQANKRVDQFKKERSKTSLKLTDPVTGLQLFVPKLGGVEKSTIFSRRGPEKKVQKSASVDLNPATCSIALTPTKLDRSLTVSSMGYVHKADRSTGSFGTPVSAFQLTPFVSKPASEC